MHIHADAHMQMRTCRCERTFASRGQPCPSVPTAFLTRIASAAPRARYRSKVQVRELTTAVSLHETGRDNLRARLAEKDQLLDETRENALQRVLALEELRKKEMESHKSRVEAVTVRVVEVMDQLRRARLDVDDFAKSMKTYESLLGYLKEEERSAQSFIEQWANREQQTRDRERTALKAQLEQLDGALAKTAAQRLDLRAEIRRATSEGEKRRAAEAATEATRLRERLGEAEHAAEGRETLAREQLDGLKAAFRGDVAALSSWVEELRASSLQANVYARTSTRLLRRQNGLLKKRIGHNALLAAQRQRRLIAWLGWRLVVQQSKALSATSARRQREVGDRNGMIEHLEGRLGDTRAKYLRQLHSLQSAHESELEAARDEVAEAHEAMARLKTFSAHKLSEMAAQLERVGVGAAATAGGGAAHANSAGAGGVSSGHGAHDGMHGMHGAEGQTTMAASPTAPPVCQALPPTDADGRLASHLFGGGAGGGAGGGSAAATTSVSSELFSRGWTEGAALTLSGVVTSASSRMRVPLGMQPLDLQPVQLLSQEKQLHEATAYVQKLERRLRRAAAAEAQLAEFKELASTMHELQAAQAAQATAASERIAELEEELRRRDALAGGQAGGPDGSTGPDGDPLGPLRLKAQAEAMAAVALAAGPRALEAARVRRELTRLRARVAGHALRQWSRARTAVCVRAWREFVWRRKAERAATAAHAAHASSAAAVLPHPMAAAAGRVAPTVRRRERVAAALARGGRDADLVAAAKVGGAVGGASKPGAMAAAHEIGEARRGRSVAAAVAAEQPGVPFRGPAVGAAPVAPIPPPRHGVRSASPVRGRALPLGANSAAAAAAARSRVALNARLRDAAM